MSYRGDSNFKVEFRHIVSRPHAYDATTLSLATSLEIVS